MPRGHPRDPRKERFWRDHLTRWQRSGLSVRAYCSRHHLAAPSFYAWRRTLAQRQGAAPAAATVTLLPLPLPPPAPAPQPLLEVVLRNGRCLRLSPGVAPGVLRDLLAVLEETPC